jgi:hypothetical protein
MTNILSIITATQLHPNKEDHQLIGQAILVDGRRPHWELHMRDRVINFIPDANHLVEEGLSQLNTYTQIPHSMYSDDPNYNIPDTLVNEFGEEECQQLRAELEKDLFNSELHFTLQCSPSLKDSKIANKVDQWKGNGVKIALHEIGKA